MKYLLVLALAFFSLTACQLKKKTLNDEDLPRDIREKSDWYLYTKTISEDDYNNIETQLQNEIEELASSKPCDSISDWTFSGMGLNACGRAAKYIAYPKEVEKEIKNKISHYNSLVTSQLPKTDEEPQCPEVKRPRALTCHDGRVELVYDEVF